MQQPQYAVTAARSKNGPAALFELFRPPSDRTLLVALIEPFKGTL